MKKQHQIFWWTKNNIQKSSVQNQVENPFTPAQMQSILLEQTKRHEQMLQQQQEEFKIKLKNIPQSSRISTLNLTTNQNFNTMPNSEKTSPNITGQSHSQSSLLPPRKWNRNHFRQMLEIQQSNIKEKLKSRGGSKIFEYASKENNNWRVLRNQRDGFIQKKPPRASSARKPIIWNKEEGGISTISLLKVNKIKRGNKISRSAMKKGNTENSVNNQSSMVQSLIEQKDNSSIALSHSLNI